MSKHGLGLVTIEPEVGGGWRLNQLPVVNDLVSYAYEASIKPQTTVWRAFKLVDTEVQGEQHTC